MNKAIRKNGKKLLNMSLNTKFILLTVVFLLVTMITTAYINFTIQKQHFIEQLYARGQSLGNFIALTSSDAVLGQDYLLMNRYMKEISHQPDIVYGVILSAKGDNLTSYLNPDSPYINKAHIDPWELSNFMDIIDHINTHDDVISMSFQIKSDSNAGSILLGLSTQNITHLSRNALAQQIVESILIISFLVACIYMLFRISVYKPVYSLIKSFTSVAKGDLDHKAPVIYEDEFGTLAKSFNRLTDSLKLTHQEKDKIVEELKTTNSQLVSATRAKSHFLANMSHEIRTPLTAIIGFGNYLKRPGLTEEEKNKALSTIIDNGFHLQHIINDILDISKIEADKLEIECIQVSLFQVMNDIESLLVLQCSERDLNYSINFDYPLPATITTDPVRFKQILFNLCSNAVKFTEQGSISIKIFYKSDINRLFISVKDSGIGLSQDQQDRIFDEFNQADTSTTRKYGGTGLGLSVSQKLAQKLGGRITVRSALDLGSKFTFELDPGELDKKDFITHAPEAQDQANNDITQIIPENLMGKILLAEDNIHNQQLIELYIRGTDATVDIVSDGKQAIDKATSNSYDLILMDMQMPVMDGLQAVHILRKNGYTRPISALTANAMQGDKNRCFEAGCDDFLSKPINEEQFYSLLEKYLPSHGVFKAEDLTSVLPDSSPELQKIVDRFINELPSISKDIAETFSKCQWDKLTVLLHTLKGTSGNMGYMRLMHIVENIEMKLHHDKTDDLVEDINEILVIIDHIIEHRKTEKKSS